MYKEKVKSIMIDYNKIGIFEYFSQQINCVPR